VQSSKTVFQHCGTFVLCTVTLQSLKLEKIFHLWHENMHPCQPLWLRHWFQCCTHTSITQTSSVQCPLSSPAMFIPANLSTVVQSFVHPCLFTVRQWRVLHFQSTCYTQLLLPLPLLLHLFIGLFSRITWQSVYHMISSRFPGDMLTKI